ncbi:MAG: DUF2892 domain-containing protein [Flavobacteriaceae bacterium]|nr:DUF2892 domain-containing protein [Flavobacteriaceae bacterium]
MKKNVGKTDKIIRTVLAIAVICIAHFMVEESPWNYILYAFGTILILTSIFSYCPAYPLLGMDTCKTKE